MYVHADTVLALHRVEHAERLRRSTPARPAAVRRSATAPSALLDAVSRRAAGALTAVRAAGAVPARRLGTVVAGRSAEPVCCAA
jgi:hypothetical protein